MDNVYDIQRRTCTRRKYTSNHQTCLALVFYSMRYRHTVGFGDEHPPTSPVSLGNASFVK